MKTLTAFQVRHIALLCKCTGSSFISGSVNNGFFDHNARSLMAAAAGLVLFIVGGFIDEYLSSHNSEPSDSMLDILLVNILLSVGIGFFTGGLQHYPFPNAAIAAWVLPLGFLLTLLALAWNFKESIVLLKPITYYTLFVTLLTLLLSFMVSRWFDASDFARKPEQAIVAVKTPSSTKDLEFLNEAAQLRSKAQLILVSSTDANTKALAQRVLDAQ